MSNSNTPNEPERYNAACDCPLCSKASARAPETATQYILREFAEALARREAEESRLRAFLKDCGCPCCSARERLRAISYDRACHSSADIHCASTDRRDDNEDARLAADAANAEKEYRADAAAERLADLKAFARAGRYADNSREETIRPAAPVYHETDTDAR